MKEKSNKHEKSEGKKMERMEKKMKSEGEYKKGAKKKSNWRGKMC